MTNTINPGKQRLSRYNADIRTRQTRMAGHVAKDLRPKAGSSLPIRVGDTVRILRGDYKKKTGAVIQVDAKRERVYIQGIQRKKADGKEAFIAFHPSKLMITGMESKDKTRLTRATTKTPAPAEKTARAKAA